QVAVVVELRRRLVKAHDRDRRADRAYHGGQRVLDSEDHLRPPALEQFQVARELQRIAQALLGMHQDRPARDVLLAQPLRPIMGPRREQTPPRLALLVETPSFLEPANRETTETVVE